MGLFGKKDTTAVNPPDSFTEQNFKLIERKFDEIFDTPDFDDLDRPFFDYKFKSQFLQTLRKMMWLAEQQFDPKRVDQAAQDLARFMKEKWYEPFEIVKAVYSFQNTNFYQNLDKRKFEVDTEVMINAVAALDNVQNASKNEVISLLQDKLSSEWKEKQKEIDLLKYATKGYIELYNQYKQKGDTRWLETLQHMKFIKNSWWLVDCYFEDLWIYISEELCWKMSFDESKDKMESYKWLYTYPKANDLDKVVSYCPGEKSEDDYKIFKKIFGWNRLFTEESSIGQNQVYWILWQSWENFFNWKKTFKSKVSAQTIGIRYGKEKA